MEADEEVISGYLLFPPGGTVFNKLNKKKNWQQKYCQLYNASKQGIERLEIYDSKEDANNCNSLPKIITLENCIKINKPTPNTITIFTKSITQHLSATTESECSQWLVALQSVAFKDTDSNLKSFNEYNELYYPIEGSFSVKLVPSDASIKFGLEPNRYLLRLTVNAIELRDERDDDYLYATWPYRYIRRYGYRKGKFTFEAGRKCETGPGIFHMEHPNQSEIFKCLSYKMKAMKQMIGNDNLHSPEHNEFQIQTSSMNMFPGSRSPLFVSRPDELNLSTTSLKVNSISSFSNSDTAPLLSPKPKPTLKPKPLKPPRKSLPKLPNETETTNGLSSETHLNRREHYEPVTLCEDKLGWPASVPYDKVEVRNEAWKTLGLNQIDHNEYTPNLSEKSNAIKFISRSQDNLNTDVSRIVLLPSPIVSPEEAGYDRLEFFGSTSKLDQPDHYKKVEPRPTTLSIDSFKSKETWNDYDEVENVMKVMTLVDDSHVGYGLIRRISASGATPGPQVPTSAQAAALSTPPPLPPPHHAIVSRPKMV